MGQSGSSELQISQEADPPSATSSSSAPASSSPPAPQLQWLRASRAGRGSLAAEWRWSERSEPAGRCHLLFLRSDAPRPGQAGRMRRVPVDPLLPGHTMSGLAEDAPYRVCLQCAAAAAAALAEAGNNRTSARPMQPVSGRPAEIMHCVNVSTKQAHLPAIIGSCLGALCALILVLALVLLSRRSKQYRKVTERQSSATAKKVMVREVSYQTENLPTPKMEFDSNSDGYIYDGSEDQQGSSASDDVLTPPPQPPPPPPTMSTPLDVAAPVEELAAEQKAATTGAELESLLADRGRRSSDADTDAEEAAAPPTPPPPPAPSMDVEAAVDTTSTPISSSTDGRQVIQVNETDEYSIDLRLCDSLSRQQSLKMSASATASSATSGSMIASASASASASGSTSAGVAAAAEQSDDSGATPTRQASDSNQPQQEDQQDQTAGTVPSLYTQLIETL